jgi:hypothetical protein
MTVKILIKRGTETQWTNSTTALMSGELGLDTTNNILKVGNGSTLWNSLPGIQLSSQQVSELAQDAVAQAFANGVHSNIVVTYNDNGNSISLATGPDVVTTTSLNNTLTNSTTGYVPISDVGSVDGVAPLDSNSLIPDAYIPSTITRDSELSTHNSATTNVHGISNTADLLNTSNTKTVTNKTIGAGGLAFNSGANSSSIYTEGNDMSVYANANLYLNGNANIVLQPATGSTASVKGDVIITSNASQSLNNKTLASPTFTGIPVAPTAASNTNTTQVATTEFVQSLISNLVDNAPSVLNTLNELSAAIGNDANYATTVTNALALKAPLASPTFTGTVSGITKDMVGLANVNNTSDALKPISLATQAALDDKLNSNVAAVTYVTQTSAANTYATIMNPTFSGTVSGITKSMVGLENVDNTSDANKPISTSTQAALDAKLNLVEPSIDYYVTNSGSGAYLVNGVSNGTIYFEKGKKYRIHVNATGHPFWIQTVSGAYSAGNIYSTGITNNGTQNGHILVELPQNAPQLYYVCQFHSMMAGSINTATTQYDNTYIPITGTTRTISSSTDKYNILEFSSGSPITVTIPNDTQDSGWSIGSSVEIRQVGTGQIVIQKDAAVTYNAPDNQFKTRTQWSSLILEKRAANTWLVTGDSTA